ncbi:MAG: ribbon-helix-helix domain-containing protein [Candidatus Woesearchaeota archaeon]
MDTVSIRFESGFLRDIELTMKSNRYATKAEFIREAIRDKIKNLEKEKALLRLEKAYGASKRKTTDKQLHEAGERAFKDLERQLK